MLYARCGWSKEAMCRDQPRGRRIGSLSAYLFVHDLSFQAALEAPACLNRSHRSWHSAAASRYATPGRCSNSRSWRSSCRCPRSCFAKVQLNLVLYSKSTQRAYHEFQRFLRIGVGVPYRIERHKHCKFERSSSPCMRGRRSRSTAASASCIPVWHLGTHRRCTGHMSRRMRATSLHSTEAYGTLKAAVDSQFRKLNVHFFQY